jgi:hypothetical protein
VALALAQRFVIRNTAGKHLASFDAEGNFVVEGNLTSSATSGQLDATTDKEFIVRQGTSNEVLRLGSSGDMYIDGKLYEGVTADLDTEVGADSLRFRDGTGHTVAMVNSTWVLNSSIEPTGFHIVPAGSIILKGRAFVGADPDRDETQGH